MMSSDGSPSISDREGLRARVFAISQINLVRFYYLRERFVEEEGRCLGVG